MGPKGGIRVRVGAVGSSLIKTWTWMPNSSKTLYSLVACKVVPFRSFQLVSHDLSAV